MAVINGYVDANIALGKLANNAACMGGTLKCAIQSFAVASTDAAGSIYRIFKGMSPDIIIKSVRLYNDALTGASSVNFGAYGVLDYDNVGAIVGSGNQIASAIDISAGNAITSTPLVFDKSISIANREVPLYTLVGHTQLTKLPAYDLCLTMTAMTTGANGNVCVLLEYVQL